MRSFAEFTPADWASSSEEIVDAVPAAPVTEPGQNAQVDGQPGNGGLGNGPRAATLPSTADLTCHPFASAVGNDAPTGAVATDMW